MYAFFKREIGSYMILANQFAFFDFEELFIWFLLDYMACMGTFVSLGYYISIVVKNTKKARSQQTGRTVTTINHKYDAEETS